MHNRKYTAYYFCIFLHNNVDYYIYLWCNIYMKVTYNRFYMLTFNNKYVIILTGATDGMSMICSVKLCLTQTAGENREICFQ